MSVPSEESLPVEEVAINAGQTSETPPAAPQQVATPAAESPATESPTAESPVADEARPTPPASPAGKPAFRVQIGSLGDPNIAREARPKPNPAAIVPLPKFDQPAGATTMSGGEPSPSPAASAGEEVEDEALAAVDRAMSAVPSHASAPPVKSYPPPNIKSQLSPELEQELAEALGDMSLEDIIGGKSSGAPTSSELEAESRVNGKVLKIHQDNVFVEIPGQREGVVSLRTFDAPPEVGELVELVVHRFNADEGLYELRLPGKAVEVADWSEIQQGAVVQAVITGHNKGGLECTVAAIRGFIPVSHIELFRVDDLQPYVGQSLAAVVTEANPDRRNLVLSRRALLEREREESRRQKFEELAVGQTHEGIVRSLQDFGAFVDLGGVDGLIHISQMSWDRINHPSEILTLGQKVKVRIEKYDRATGKIGLSYRDQATNPWNNVSQNYPIGSRHTGRVTKVMQFGAFVKLEPGVEGMVHISEISWQRVARVSDVVKEGLEVEVQVASVDMDNQRIGLSMKALETRPTPVDKAKELEEKMLDELEAAAPAKKKHTGPLKGGTGKSSGGEKFGLNW